VITYKSPTENQQSIGEDPQNKDKAPEAPLKSVFLTHPYKEKIEKYHSLAKKVLRPEEESKWLKEVAGDRVVLDSLKDLLVNPAQTSEEAELQDAALDILISSVVEEPRGPAVEVVESIVANNLIERESLPREQRESLAGVKGEVMMKWLSADPTQENSMGSRLPGAVSEKIWKNVLGMKENNRKESETLRH
jgi:hypothetical protein